MFSSLMGTIPTERPLWPPHLKQRLLYVHMPPLIVLIHPSKDYFKLRHQRRLHLTRALLPLSFSAGKDTLQLLTSYREMDENGIEGQCSHVGRRFQHREYTFFNIHVTEMKMLDALALLLLLSVKSLFFIPVKHVQYPASFIMWSTRVYKPWFRTRPERQR